MTSRSSGSSSTRSTPTTRPSGSTSRHPRRRGLPGRPGRSRRPRRCSRCAARSTPRRSDTGFPDAGIQSCGIDFTAPGVAFSPSGRQLAEGLCRGAVVIADGRTGRVVRTVRLGGPGGSVQPGRLDPRRDQPRPERRPADRSHDRESPRHRDGPPAGAHSDRLQPGRGSARPSPGTARSRCGTSGATARGCSASRPPPSAPRPARSPSAATVSASL